MNQTNEDKKTQQFIKGYTLFIAILLFLFYKNKIKNQLSSTYSFFRYILYKFISMFPYPINSTYYKFRLRL